MTNKHNMHGIHKKKGEGKEAEEEEKEGGEEGGRMGGILKLKKTTLRLLP